MGLGVTSPNSATAADAVPFAATLVVSFWCLGSGRVRHGAAEWQNVGRRSTMRTGISRAISVVAALATVTQVSMAVYRSRVEETPPWVGIALASVLLVPILSERGTERRYVRSFTRACGFVFLLVGLLAVLAAFASPALGMVQRVSLPLFFLSMAAMVLLESAKTSAKVLVLLLFVLSFVGLQTVATIESHHVRELRKDGVLGHWH